MKRSNVADESYPRTTFWRLHEDEFSANNDKIKAGGITPVVSRFKNTWTSQLYVLGDDYNVQKKNPDKGAIPPLIAFILLQPQDR